MTLKDTVEYLSQHIGPRAPGSSQEKATAQWISSQLGKLGYKPEIETFACPATPAQKAELICEPDLDCAIIPTQHSPLGQATGELVWLGFSVDEPAFTDLQGKIGLLAVQGDLHEYHTLLDKLEAAGLAGLIVIGPYSDSLNGKTVRSGRLTRMPVATVSINDARRLKQELSGRQVTLTITGKPAESTSQNVVATLPGRTENTLVIMAHYDSAASCPGAMDNASGIAIMLELAKLFAAKTPDNSICFVATGAEEFGGLDFCGAGAEAFFANRTSELDKIVAVFELDHIGDSLGQRRLRFWGPDAFMNTFPKPDGFLLDQTRPVGGDGGGAYKNGIPSVSMTDRFIASPYYHGPRDTIDLLDFDALAYACNAAVAIADSLAAAKPFYRCTQHGEALIRPAREADIDAICEITRLAFEPVSTDRMREDFYGQKLGGKHWWEYKLQNVRDFALGCLDWIIVAEIDRQVVGYASYILDSRRRMAEVGNNAVLPTFQGRGLGKAMQAEIIKRFEEEGYQRWTVSTLCDDLPARRIYEKMGFKELTQSITYQR